jgi:hypothetical protein
VVDASLAERYQACPSCHAPLKAATASKAAAPPSVRGENLSCPCGGRVFVRVDEIGKQTKCPSCGREMRIEKKRDPQTLATRLFLAEAKPKTAAMIPPAPPKELPAEVELKCACGASVFVRPEWAGKHAQCPKCRLDLRVVKMRDPATDSTRLILVGPGAKKDAAPPRPKPDAPPPPAAAPSGSTPLTCVCGGPIYARPEHVGKPAQCPSCGREMRVVKKLDPETQTTRLILVAPKAKKPPAPPKPEPPAAPPTPPPAQHDLICPCGAQLQVGREHAGKQVQCASCGTLMKIEVAPDAKSGATVIRARVIGKVDLDSWSLDDFE